MRPIGFSTGALAKGDFRRGLEILRRHKIEIVELSALRQPELEPLMSSLDDLDLADHTQRFLDADEYTNVPPSWEAAVFEDTFTGFDGVALDRGWDEDPERFSIALQIHVSGDEGTTAYWIAWYGPQSERRAYDDVIRDTFASFTPRESTTRG